MVGPDRGCIISRIRFPAWAKQTLIENSLTNGADSYGAGVRPAEQTNIG